MRHNWIKLFVKDFETNARFQFKFHLCAMIFWLLNAVVVTTLYVVEGSKALTALVFYCVLISLYANWDTDYDAVSASQAAMHGEDLLKKTEDK